MNKQLPSDSMVSGKLATLAEAREKAEDAARIIQGRFPGSYVRWENERMLKVISNGRSVATIIMESLQ